MIAFVEGTVEYIEENAAVIRCGGFGCRVFMSVTSLSLLKKGEEVRVFTYLRVAEDLFDLYGFLQKEELDMFKLLIGVNGAGPKAAMSVLSALSPAALSVAVVTDDYKAITRAQGVGPKLAQKIVLELKDKLKGKEIDVTASQAGFVQTGTSSRSEAVEALVVLGYAQAEAMRAVSAVPDGLTSEETIKAALLQLMKHS